MRTSLEVSSNDPDESPITVGLKGQGGCDSNYIVNTAQVRFQGPDTCWATAATIMYNAVRGQSYTEQQVTNIADGQSPDEMANRGYFRFQYDINQGLTRTKLVDFLTKLGIRADVSIPARPSPCELAQLLRQHGPLWITTGSLPFVDEETGLQTVTAHAEVVVGVQGDGSLSGSRVIKIDPLSGRVERNYQDLFLQIGWPQWWHF